MKIGILTFHRAHNYGAVLQAYALKAFLNEMGYNNVSFIDYWPKYHDDVYRLFNIDFFKSLSIIDKIKYIIRYLLMYKRRKKRYDLFLNFIDKYLSPKTNYKNEIYDLAIYGSDQIWRNQKNIGFEGYDSVYFGDERIRAKRKITYSVSMGILCDSDDIRLILMKNIHKFNAISVRESDLLNYIVKYYNNVCQTLDPVFLIPKESWLRLIDNKKKKYKNYILVYNLQSNKQVENIASRISKKTGYPIIHIVGSVIFKVSHKNYYEDVGPIDFISLIYNASYVVTSSFHGTAFSLIFNKEIFVSMTNNYQRVISLLNLVGLSSRFISNENEIELEYKRIAWSNTNEKLDKYIKDSKNYLLKNIN